MSQQGLHLRFGLVRCGRQIEAENVEGAEKRPKVGGRDSSALKVADDFPQLSAITDRRFGDEALG